VEVCSGREANMTKKKSEMKPINPKKKEVARSPVYTSYSGTDLIIDVKVEGERLYRRIGEAQGISYAATKKKILGIFPTTEIVGSINCICFDRNVLAIVLGKYFARIEDKLPAFDMIATALNENGQVFQMHIVGCEITDNYSRFDIEDIVLVDTVSFKAKGMIPWLQTAPVSGVAPESGLNPEGN
jgi:hypothetical protein